MTRIERMRAQMNERRLPAYLVTRMSHITYLTGFTGTTAFLLVEDDRVTFLTDGRYEEQAAEELVSGLEVQIAQSYTESLAAMGKRLPRMITENETSLRVVRLMEDEGATIDVDAEDIVGRLRMVKEPDEVALIRRAFEVAGNAFLAALPEFRPGRTEREWAAILEYEMKKRGAREASFETIVAAGERGALPHGTASDRIITPADPVVIDYGARLDYCSDATRMVYGGDDAEVLKVMDIVRTAMESAMDAVKPGVSMKTLDTVARNVIAEAGYGDRFNHGLGHGVGIDVHESPAVNFRDDSVAETGMVFTIEPGIYLPGRFGVRLEQTVLVTEKGCELLTAMIDNYLYRPMAE